MSTELIAIYGAGGFAREVAWLLQDCIKAGSNYEIVGFIDDDPQLQGTNINGFHVRTLEDTFQQVPHAKVVLAVGSPHTRQKIAHRCYENGFQSTLIVHPRVEMSDLVEMKVGTIICAGNILTVNISIGEHVHINLDCTLGHDVIIDDYVTLAPGVHVSGYVRIGKRAYIGTGAVIINGNRESPLVIGEDAVVGAGACVIKSVAPKTTVVGVPAKPIKKD